MSTSRSPGYSMYSIANILRPSSTVGVFFLRPYLAIWVMVCRSVMEFCYCPDQIVRGREKLYLSGHSRGVPPELSLPFPSLVFSSRCPPLNPTSFHGHRRKMSGCPRLSPLVGLEQFLSNSLSHWNHRWFENLLEEGCHLDAWYIHRSFPLSLLAYLLACR